jgi:serine protease
MEKKQNLTLILSILIFLMFGINLSANDDIYNTEILYPSLKYNRKDKVFKKLINVRFKPGKNESELLSLNNLPNVRVIKGYLNRVNALTYLKMNNQISNMNTGQVNKIIRAEEPLLRTYMIEFNEDIAPEDFAKKVLSENPNIEIAEPVYIGDICGEFIPNDPLIVEQPMLKTIHAFEAWDVYKGDSNIVIGISDSGILQTHEDLAANIWINKNEIPDDSIDNDNNGYIDDYNGYNFTYLLDNTRPGNTYNASEGHGTGTTGISSAICNNGKGVAGVGFNTKFFPMKTMSQNSSGIIFGFESIIYAADMGFKVINLSWGGRSYSDINQTIIDYAVAKDVAIIAAAGNHGSSDPYYPAAYKGVMGVGVTDTNDIVIPMSALGAAVDIMAPGDNTRTTSNDSTYGRFCCTSGAAPIISAQVALIRGLHPELNNLQAIEFARLCSDNIELNNRPEIRKLIPGRVNLLKSVSIDPMSIPAIRPLEYYYQAEGSPDKIRFSIDDTIKFKIMFKNYLGATKNLEFTLSTVGDSLNSIVILDSILTEDKVAAGEEFYSGDFRFTINKFNPERPFFRVDIKGDNYVDYFLIPFTPYVNFTTFSNEAITVSACDNGRLGYNDPPADNLGYGLKQNGKNSVLFEGGLMISEDSQKVITQARLINNKSYSDFAPVKPYIEPNENIAVFNDSFAPDSTRMNIEIENTMEMPEANVPCFRLFVKLRNVSNRILKNIAIGYFLDWDIGISGDDNTAFPWNELLPVTMRDNPHCLAGLIARNGDYERIGIAVNSNHPNSEPIFASFLNSETQSVGAFSFNEQIKYLNSGHSLVCENSTDIATVVGMKFNCEIAAGDSVSYEFTICVQDSIELLRKAIWHFLDPSVNYIDNQKKSDKISIYPNPTDDKVIVKGNNIISCEIIDLLGNRIAFIENNNNNDFVIDATDYSSGLYLIKLNTNQGITVKQFIKK